MTTPTMSVESILSDAADEALKVLHDGQPRSPLRAQNHFIELLRQHDVTRPLADDKRRAQLLSQTREPSYGDYRLFESQMRNYHRR